MCVSAPHLCQPSLWPHPSFQMSLWWLLQNTPCSIHHSSSGHNSSHDCRVFTKILTDLTSTWFWLMPSLGLLSHRHLAILLPCLYTIHTSFCNIFTVCTSSQPLAQMNVDLDDFIGLACHHAQMVVKALSVSSNSNAIIDFLSHSFHMLTYLK